MARRLASLVVCGLVLLPHTSAVSPCPNTPPGAVCCGDGTVQGDGTGNSGELCDQGQVQNQQPATGCTAGCVTDPFWYCSGSPSTCRLSSRYQVTGTGSLRMLSGVATQSGFQNLFSAAIAQVTGLKNPTFNVINPLNGISQFNFDLAEVNAALIPDLTTQLKTLAASRGMAVTFNHNCGNGLVELGELCDDALRNHGCSPTCTPDSLNKCYGNLVSEQAQNPPRTLQRQICTLCGNGQRNGNEQCDDGNVDNNDGCTAHCLVQSGWTCTGFPSVCTLAGVVLPVPVVVPQLCGNGQRNGLEQCDDGNLNNLDGCTSLCTVEAGFTCSPVIAGGPDVCRRVVVPVVVPVVTNVCGDGVRSSIESCDDRNSIIGDGCTNLCTIEPGWTCIGEIGFLSTCSRIQIPQVEAIGFDTDDDDSFEWWYLLIPLAICLLLSCLLALLMRKPKETPPPRYIPPPPPPVVKPEVPFMVHEAPAQSPAVVYEVYDTFDDPVYA